MVQEREREFFGYQEMIWKSEIQNVPKSETFWALTWVPPEEYMKYKWILGLDWSHPKISHYAMYMQISKIPKAFEIWNTFGPKHFG
jgi:hypothetical protein